MTRALLALLCLVLAGGAVRAATVIRDDEIETTVHRIADPIFDAAGLEHDEVSVYILRDDKLNAFVAGGENLFLNTGLIVRTESPAQLAGVIAHETGHIAGGHLSRASQARGRATVQSIVGALLGAAAAVAGAPEVGTAIMAGGATFAQRDFLAFSRSQEESADTAAVGFLASEQKSPAGLVEFFKILQNQNLGISRDGAEFLRTHPLTQSRIDFLQGKVDASPYKDSERWPPDLVEAHRRTVAKLDAYLGDPDEVIARYKGAAVADRYAQAIALYRQAHADAALAKLGELTRTEPGNPYFQEFRGQVLFEAGRVAAAEPAYREALHLRPGSTLMRYELARSLMEQENPTKLGEARALLQEVVRNEPENAGAWRQLGTAEGRLGNAGPATLALVEEAVLLHRKDDAQAQLRRAQDLIGPNDPGYLRLQDLETAVADMDDPRPPRR